MIPQTPERRPLGGNRAPVGGFTTAPSVAQHDHDDADDAPRCIACHRPLTLPESVARGFGPHCHARVRNLTVAILAAGGSVVVP